MFKSDNYKWIFSGIGVVIITSIISFFLNKNSQNNLTINHFGIPNNKILPNKGNITPTSIKDSNLSVKTSNREKDAENNQHKIRDLRFSGRIYDNKTNSPLNGVEVSLENYVITSDSDGKFELKIKTSKNLDDVDKLFFYKKGYNEASKLIYLNHDEEFTIYLTTIR